MKMHCCRSLMVMEPGLNLHVRTQERARETVRFPQYFFRLICSRLTAVFHCARVSAFGCSRLLRSKAVHCPRYAVWLPRTLILQSSRPNMHTQINVHFTFYIEETIVHVRSDICVKHQTEKTPSRKWHSYSPYSQLRGCDPNVGRRLDLS